MLLVAYITMLITANHTTNIHICCLVGVLIMSPLFSPVLRFEYASEDDRRNQVQVYGASCLVATL